MRFLKRFDYRFSFVIFQQIFTIIHFSGLWAVTSESSPRSSLTVGFNPYVSILDKWNQNRYNISELVPILAKVASQFDRILIDLEDTVIDVKESENTFPLNLSSSLLLSPLAAATYNKLSNASKLEVWLAFTHSATRHDPIKVSRHLKYIAQKANDIYNGTVGTILVPFEYSSKKGLVERIQNETAYESFVFTGDYKWGLIRGSDGCYSPAILGNGKAIGEKIKELNIDMVLLDMDGKALHSDIFSKCEQYKIRFNITNLALWFRPSDTDHNGVIDLTGFVAKWNLLEMQAKRNVLTIVVSKAFDSVCSSESDCKRLSKPVGDMTQGWWRLKENPDYSSTSDFIFEAKNDIAERFDREANSIDVTLLEKGAQNLTSEYLGVRFSFVNFPKNNALKKMQVAESLAFEGILGEVISSYSKIVVTVDHQSSKNHIPEELNFIARYFLRTMHVFLIVVPNEITIELVRATLGRKSPNKQLTLAFAFNTESIQWYRSNEQFIRNQSDLNAKTCFVFHVSHCERFQRFTSAQMEEVLDVLKISDTVLFSFEEVEETVKLGVDRMFQQRLVTFGQCRKFISKINSMNNSTIEMGFLMWAYDGRSNYKNDAIALYNFVLYWDKLRDWAANTETTVIMSGVVDRVTRFDKELGWWRRHSKKEMKKSIFFNFWIDKRTELFHHPDVVNAVVKSKKKNSSSESAGNGDHNYVLSTKEIIAIVASVVVIVSLVIIFLLFYLPKRHSRLSRHTFLSDNEVDEFYHGGQHSNAFPSGATTSLYKLPYNKSKFEIRPKRFSIDYSQILGSGEFGVVCPGKVKKSDGTFVDVAVKMVNSNAFHKTTLTGLLSEIKVLAHLGKHENIVELLGAFTRDLKLGKLFVFLELCRCGSLEKYLRNIRRQQSTNSVVVFREDGIELTEMPRAVDNTIQHSDDLYRWSREICCGMSFLASKHVVHADLATRNVLLNAEKTAKICDFGLSRRMYNYTNYVKQSQEPLPWKWMSPESLRLMEFNEKTDVWAYGITLWEIYSLGDVPYQGLSWDFNFSQILEDGYRMGKPKYNDRNMYSMMMKCWVSSPLERPSFADLLLLLGENEIR